ncbi:MAG: tetratricopeptide repeat protein, partial [Pyrinomonadaceae bacterium]
MKHCPTCNKTYTDESLNFCLDDGAWLAGGAHRDEPVTAILSGLGVPPSGGSESEPGAIATGFRGDEGRTAASTNTTDQTAILRTGPEAEPQTGLGRLSEKQSFSARRAKPLIVVVVAAIVLIGGFFGYRYFSTANSKQIESIAVMPFVNESGNADVEYLSDGMTETLISSLSQIPKLNVKARSSVFRYKGKETNAQTIGQELNVQAILNGRVIQRGEDLILYVELVDAQNENSLWKQTYNKTMTNLVSLQNDIARDVADKLKVKLSGADARKLVKNYTENVEAYQRYLKGRYHVFKLTPPEVQKSIAYFQEAIEIDPSYALAYAGLSDAYRSLVLVCEMRPTETMPKSKAAAITAIEIDGDLAEAHTVLGVSLFWYDWNWTAAEEQYKRALELDPNNSLAHLFYAHLLSNTGRHSEALAEVKRARELDPLSSFVGTLEGQFLLHAGQTDMALERLRQSSELDPSFFFPHIFASSAYIAKGMYREAAEEAFRAKELAPNQTSSVSFGAYALAKLGKREEARAVLDELL